MVLQHGKSVSDQNIGGFIGLQPISGSLVREDRAGLLLTSGRACFAAILDILRPSRVHLPFYTCNSLIAPVVERGIPYAWYGIDDRLLPVTTINVDHGEIIVLIDYFGVRTSSVNRLAEQYGERAVIDDTHAFHSGAHPGGQWSFNSARKFFGVPDGGYLFGPGPFPEVAERNVAVNGDHLILRSLGASDLAYASYRSNEQRMTASIVKANALSEAILCRTDIEDARKRRNANFRVAHGLFNSMGGLHLDEALLSAPLCYPLLMRQAVDLPKLHAHGLYLPKYWPDILSRSEAHDFPTEMGLTERLLAFPIDQRYSEKDIEHWGRKLLSLL